MLGVRGERVLVVGCGTSAFVADSLAALRERAGLGVTDAAYASEWRRRRGYDRRRRADPLRDDDRDARRARACPAGVTTSSITGVAGSPVAKADRRGPRARLRRRASRRADPLPDHRCSPLARAVSGTTSPALVEAGTDALAAAAAGRCRGLDHFVYLGSGWTHGLAHEAALKIREAAQAWSESYPLLDYRHGPIAVARRSARWSGSSGTPTRARRRHRADRRHRRHDGARPARPARPGPAARGRARREPAASTPTPRGTSRAPSSSADPRPSRITTLRPGVPDVPFTSAPRPSAVRRGLAARPRHRRRRRSSLSGCAGSGGARARPSTPKADVTLTWWTGQDRRRRDDPRGPRRRSSRRSTRTSRSTCPRAPRRPRTCCRSCRRASRAAPTPTSRYAFGSWASQLETSGRTLDITDRSAEPDVELGRVPRGGPRTPRSRPGDKTIGFPAVVDNISLLYNTDAVRRGRRRLPDRRLDLGRLPRRREGADRPAHEHLRLRVLGVGQRGDHLAVLAAPVAERRRRSSSDDGKTATFDSQAGVDALTFLRDMAVDDKSVYLDQTDTKFGPAVRERPHRHDHLRPVAAVRPQDRRHAVRRRRSCPAPTATTRPSPAPTSGRSSTTRTPTARTGRTSSPSGSPTDAGRALERRLRQPAAARRARRPARSSPRRSRRSPAST